MSLNPQLSLFHAILLEIESLLAEVSLDKLHERVLQRALDKLRTEFLENKIFAALLLPGMAWRALKQEVSPSLVILAATHFLFYAFLDLTDDIEDEELTDFTWQQQGVAVAINTGTSLLFLSQLMLERLNRHGVSSEVQLALHQLFMQAGWCLTIGQHRDLSSLRLSAHWEAKDVQLTHLLKTGSSVRLYLESVAILNQSSEAIRHALAELGENCGCLAQLIGDWQNLAESPSSDLSNHCLSLPLAYLQMAVTGDDQAALSAALSLATQRWEAQTLIRHLLHKYQIQETLNTVILAYHHAIENALVQLNELGCETHELTLFASRFRLLEGLEHV